ncbi:MAG TPA: hypothetical protein VK652_11540 [Steroidobacteraceae bacterium]|nr:hypothetical protein [Steroidobacteraceae bacterium]
MRTKVKPALPEVVLTRILRAFGQELIDVSDEEIMQAAKDLGMNPHMKGSAAFLGLTFPAKPDVSDFFDVNAIEQHISREAREHIANTTSRDPESQAAHSKLPDNSTDRKGSGQK